MKTQKWDITIPPTRPPVTLFSFIHLLDILMIVIAVLVRGPQLDQWLDSLWNFRVGSVICVIKKFI